MKLDKDTSGGVWPPAPHQVEMAAPGRHPDSPLENRRGWIGVILALLGFLLPVGYYIPANNHYMNAGDLAWGEGGGFLALIFCMLIVLVSEAVALRLGLDARHVRSGKVAVAISVGILGVLLWFAVVLFLDVVQH